MCYKLVYETHTEYDCTAFLVYGRTPLGHEICFKSRQSTQQVIYTKFLPCSLRRFVPLSFILLLDDNKVTGSHTGGPRQGSLVKK